MENWNHEYAKVNGVRLHYVKEGSGDSLVIMLHGWPEFWYSWRHQITALKSKFTVVAPDLRGFNLSGKPDGIKSYTQEEVAKDIVALIGHLGFKKAVVVGHDWGGAIAWHIALNYPDLVEKFVVMNCPHPAIFIKNIKSNPSQLLRSWYMFFFQLPYVPELAMNFDLKRFFVKAFRDWSYHKENFSDVILEKYVEAYQQKGALTGGINYYRANIRAVREEKQHQNRKVTAPTLMIWGEGDKALGTELIDGTEKYIDNSFKVHRIKECSHWVQNDCWEEVNSVLLDFLQ